MPHLRALVERYEGRPFAIVGVNTSDSEDAYREGVEKYKLSWISAFQGVSSPISDMYRVTGYPTMLMIDHEGKIQWRDHQLGDSQEELLETLVTAAEAAADE